MPLLCENRLFKAAFFKTIEAQIDAERLLSDFPLQHSLLDRLG